MFPDRGGKVLCLYKPHVLAAGVRQNVTEGMHATAAFGGEPDLIGRIIHLCLHPWTRLEAAYGRFGRVRPENAQTVAHDRVVALETQAAQLLVQANRG